MIDRFRRRIAGMDLLARLVLLVAGVAGLTIARTYSFIGSMPDNQEPHIPILLWLFHQADLLVLPGVNRLPGIGRAPVSTPVAYIQCAALGLALICLFLAARSTIPRIPRRLAPVLIWPAIVVGLLLTVLMVQGTLPYGLALRQSHHYGNDAVSVTSCAIDEFLRAENPYSRFRVIPCLKENFTPDLVAIKTTPLQQGRFRHTPYYPTKDQLVAQFTADAQAGVDYPPEFESYYSYPAASFLVPAIAVALHLHDLSVFYSLCYLVIVGLVLWRARGAARLVAFVPILANAALWPTISTGATDGLYAMLVLLAWATRDRRWPSALLLGLAIASRQQAWFYLLFYTVLVWRTAGRREALGRLAIAGGLFALTNLPFMLLSPGAWFAGVFGPLRDAMFPRGTGMIALSLGGQGALPLFPHAFYTGLEFAVLVACLAYYVRACRTHPGTGLVLAPAALFFAWRSLYSYFLPLSLLALYPALAEHLRSPEPVIETPGATRDGPAQAAEAAA